MTVADILQAKRRETFGRNLKLALIEKCGSVDAFLKLAYGVDDKGKTKGSGAIYPVLTGKTSPGPAMKTHIVQALGLSEDQYDAMSKGPAPDPPPAEWETRRAGGRPKGSGAGPANQLEFTITHDGTANLRLDLQGIPLVKAMELVASLSQSGILNTETSSTNTPALASPNPENSKRPIPGSGDE